MIEFKDIPGFEGLYKASSEGYIIAYPKWIHGAYGGSRFHEERVLIRDVSDTGYLRVTLYKDKIKKRFLVHRLIGFVFIPNPNSLPEINHKNGIKADCRPDNLEWATKSHNMTHKFRVLKHKAPMGGLGRFNEKHPNSKPIIQLSLDGQFIKEWPNAPEVKRSLGIGSSGNIASCAQGRLKTAYGYKWAFKSV